MLWWSNILWGTRHGPFFSLYSTSYHAVMLQVYDHMMTHKISETWCSTCSLPQSQLSCTILCLDEMYNCTSKLLPFCCDTWSQMVKVAAAGCRLGTYQILWVCWHFIWMLMLQTETAETSGGLERTGLSSVIDILAHDVHELPTR